MTEQALRVAVVPLWLTAASGWAAWVAAHAVTGVLRPRR